MPKTPNVFIDTFGLPSNQLSHLASLPLTTFLNDVDFSQSVVHEKLIKLKSSKSPGPEHITSQALRNCADTLSGPPSIFYSPSHLDEEC